MSPWTPTVFLDADSREPVYLQVARALMEGIAGGRLRPGDPLPGYRQLAAELGVNRNTVMAAYRELQAEGWVESRVGSGSVVAEAPPARLPGRPPSRAAMGFDLVPAEPAEALLGAEVLRAQSGVPDPRLLPVEALARAYRRAALAAGREAFRREDPQGHPRLREALARFLASTRGVAAGPERILVTRGSQMALALAAEALLAPGDAVAVEALGRPESWEALTRAGARLVPVPVDAEGLDVAALEARLAEGPLRAVLVTPQRQMPTLAVLSPARRSRLLALARAHRFAVLERDEDSEFRYEGRPLAPLAAGDGGQVLHLGTLSKLFSPGLRLGFALGPEPLVRRMAELRRSLDRQGDLVLERAFAELMEDGELHRHLNRVEAAHRRRRDALAEALQARLGDRVDAAPPTGGLAFWVPVRAAVDVEAWAAAALRRGAAFQPGRRFAFDGAPVPALRVGFAAHREEELRELAARMAAAWPGPPEGPGR